MARADIKTNTNSKKVKNSNPNRPEIFDVVLAVICLFVLVVTLVPFLNVLAISFNDPIDTMRNVNMLFPRVFTVRNYVHLFSENNLMTPFITSVSRTVIGTGLSLLATSMFSYVLSRKDFVFRKGFNIFAVVTMYVSGGLIPSYLLIVRGLNLGGSFWVYIIPGLISVWNVILIRSYINSSIPYSIQEAARVDGAGDFCIWFRIIFPLSTPVLATVALFIAVGQWNSFMDTYLYAKNLPTLQYILYEITQKAQMKIDPHSQEAAEQLKNAVSPLSLRMAVTIVATVPILIVYPFLQKYFVGGLTLGAVKN